MNLTTLLLLLAVWYLFVRPLLKKMSGEIGMPAGDKDAVMRAIFKVAGAVAHADGEVTQDELNMVVNIVRQALRAPQKPASEILREFHKWGKTPLSQQDVAQVSPRFRRVILNIAIMVAVSDHVLDRTELERIRQIGVQLEINSTEIEDILRTVTSQTGNTRQNKRGNVVNAVDYAVDVMKLNKDADFPAVKKQYKRLALKYHPDRVPDNEKKNAEEKFKELNDAYRILKSHFN